MTTQMLYNSMCESAVSRSDGGTLFHTKDPVAESAWSPSFRGSAGSSRSKTTSVGINCWQNVLDHREWRYVRQSWWSIRCIRVAILKVMWWRISRKWSFFRAGVMWALRSRPRTRRAAIFCTRCRGAIVDVERLIRTELQLSMRWWTKFESNACWWRLSLERYSTMKTNTGASMEIENGSCGAVFSKSASQIEC